PRYVRAPFVKVRSTHSPRALAAHRGQLHRGNASALREKTNGDPRAALGSRQDMRLLAKCPEKYPALSTPRPSSGNKNDTVAVNFAQPPQQREAENLPGASTSNKGRTFRDGRRPRLSKERVKVKW